VSEFDLELVESRARDLLDELSFLGELGELNIVMLLDGLACAGLTLCADPDMESSRAFVARCARHPEELLRDF
jgi:hypothetical protein